jgi:hypothetical protein
MRACARVALISVAVSGSFGLAGCAAIDDLRDAISRWFESAKFPGGGEVFPDDGLPHATPTIPPEKIPREEASKASKEKAKPARQPQRPQAVKQAVKKQPPISDSTKAARPEGTEGQSTPSQPAPLRLRTPYPEAPPPGFFSPGIFSR